MYLNKVLVADEDGCCSTEIMPVRFHGGIVPEYARMCLMSPFFLSYANNRSYGAKMPRLGADDARAALFPLPPLAEQRRIVARAEAILAKLEGLRPA